MTRPATTRASGLQLSPASSGARSTATTIWTTSTTGKTRIAERLWRAVISESSPVPPATAVAASHARATSHVPEDTPSARNFVLNPVHAYASPALQTTNESKWRWRRRA
jgi:hypothetical protein